MSIARKLRAIVGMGVVWGLAWIPITLGSIALISFRAGLWPPLSLLAEGALAGALAGGASGMVFAGLLALTERQRTVAELSPRKLALLGVLAGVIPACLLFAQALLRVDDASMFFAPALVRVLAVSSILGAACAGGILYVARRAPSLPSDEDGGRLPNSPVKGGGLARL